MTKSLLTMQNLAITSEKEFQELRADCGQNAVKEICKSVQVFDSQSTATLEYFYDIKDAIETAKDKFFEENGEELPAQVNVDLFVVEKDGEEFDFYFVEFMSKEGSWIFGTTYASDGEAVKIFKGEESIDASFLRENGDFSSEQI